MVNLKIQMRNQLVKDLFHFQPFKTNAFVKRDLFTVVDEVEIVIVVDTLKKASDFPDLTKIRRVVFQYQSCNKVVQQYAEDPQVADVITQINCKEDQVHGWFTHVSE